MHLIEYLEVRVANAAADSNQMRLKTNLKLMLRTISCKGTTLLHKTNQNMAGGGGNDSSGGFKIVSTVVAGLSSPEKQRQKESSLNTRRIILKTMIRWKIYR